MSWPTLTSSECHARRLLATGSIRKSIFLSQLHLNTRTLKYLPVAQKITKQIQKSEDCPRLSWWFSFFVTTSSLNLAPPKSSSSHCTVPHHFGKGLEISAVKAVWVYFSLLAAFLVILHTLYRNNAYTSQENVSPDRYELVSSRLNRTGRFYRMFLPSGPQPSSGKFHKCLEA